MSDPNSDEDLKNLYARQRAGDQEHLPGFQAMRTRTLEEYSGDRASRPAMLRWAWPLAATAAVVLTAVAFRVAPHSSTAAKAASREEAVRQIELIDAALQKDLANRQSITAWQSPTDFLLKSNTTEIP
jgi:hypothetical protein